MSEFKEKYSIKSRLEESQRVLNKFPDRIPIICERDKNSSLIPKIDKKKFLVPYDMNLCEFIVIIRKKMKIPPDMAIFILINNTIHASSESLSYLYHQYKDQDGFLYITYCGENTFG